MHVGNATPVSPEDRLLRLLFHVRDTAPSDHEGTRGNIAAVAIELFTQLGYGGTSMRAIAAQVGIQAASIYAHFPGGKRQILAEGLSDIYNDFLQHVSTALDPDMSHQRQLETLIERHITWVLEAGTKSPAWDAAYRGLGVHGVLDDAELDKISKLRDLYHGYLESLFAAKCGLAEAPYVTEAAIILCDSAPRFSGGGSIPPEQTAQLVRDLAFRVASTEKRT